MRQVTGACIGCVMQFHRIQFSIVWKQCFRNTIILIEDFYYNYNIIPIKVLIIYILLNWHVERMYSSIKKIKYLR